MKVGLTWREIIGEVVGAILAVLAVTAASYLWRLPQAYGPQAVLYVYIGSAILLLAGAFVIFRMIVRHGYEQNRHLTPLPFFLQLLIWGVFFAFPCIYNPYDWAWSQSSISQAIPSLMVIGWICVGLGLLIVIGALLWLGLVRSTCQPVKKLEQAGPYCLTRNPQCMGGALLIVGIILLWPSWYAFGWLVLFAAMVHMMVRTEEEHLQRIFGQEYERYCQRVPRYLGPLRK